MNARFLSALALVSMLTVACGGNNNNVVPPPIATNPNPTGYGGTYGGGGSCGAVGGGQPLHPDNSPYFGALQSLDYSGGSASNSLSVNLNYFTQTNADNNVQNIVGSGNFNFPDINVFIPAGSQVPTSFCVSSANPQGGTVTPGTLYNGGIQLILDGVMQTPYVSPFGGYPGSYNGGQQAFGQSLVEVAIGVNGGAGIYQGRILGSVVVTLGAGTQGAITLRYQSQ